MFSSARRASAESHRACPRPASCNLDLPLRWAEPLLITPRLHPPHRVPATTNCNFGTVLSIWDRVADPLVLADTALQVPIGVPGGLDTYTQRFPDLWATVPATPGPGPKPFRAHRRRLVASGLGGGRSGAAAGSPEDILPARGEDVERERGTACYEHSGEIAGGSGRMDDAVLGKLGRRAPPRTPSGPRSPLHGSDACGAAGATRRRSPATMRRRRPWWLGRLRRGAQGSRVVHSSNPAGG